MSSASDGSPERVPLIAGNWKMHLDLDGAREAAGRIAAGLPDDVRAGRIEAALFPSALLLPTVVEAVAGAPVHCGAQDMHWARDGAFTGETSGPMILSARAGRVLLGHSERRQLFGETDERVARKLGLALELGLRPIVCVGETLDQRRAGVSEEVVEKQVAAALADRSAEDCARLDVAYEPVWAIGTGVTATPEQATAMHVHIRGCLAGRFGPAGASVRILYGGSVNPENIEALMASPEIDGGLVGGASLKPESFLELLTRTASVRCGHPRTP